MGLCWPRLLPPLPGLAVSVQLEGRKWTSSMSHHFPDVYRTLSPGLEPNTEQHLLAMKGSLGHEGESHSISSEPGGLAAQGKEVRCLEGLTGCLLGHQARPSEDTPVAMALCLGPQSLTRLRTSWCFRLVSEGLAFGGCDREAQGGGADGDVMSSAPLTEVLSRPALSPPDSAAGGSLTLPVWLPPGWGWGSSSCTGDPASSKQETGEQNRSGPHMPHSRPSSSLPSPPSLPPAHPYGPLLLPLPPGPLSSLCFSMSLPYLLQSCPSSDGMRSQLFCSVLPLGGCHRGPILESSSPCS